MSDLKVKTASYKDFLISSLSARIREKLSSDSDGNSGKWRACLLLLSLGFLLTIFMGLRLTRTTECRLSQALPGKGKQLLASRSSAAEKIPWRKFRNLPLDSLPLCEMGSKEGGIYPCLDNLKFNNLYYQHLARNDVDMYLYSAFHDHRDQSKIRILGMVAGPGFSAPTLKCQFYKGNRTYGFRKGQFQVIYHRMQKKWPVPFTLKCALEEGEPIPDAVSVLTSEAEEASNILKVFQREEKTSSNESHPISLCAKTLHFTEDSSYLLTEWLEILKSMEVGKVFAYGLQSHPSMERVLEFYEDQGGFVDYIPITFPGTQQNIPGFEGSFLLRNELFRRAFYHLQLNDCLYRSLVQGYEYVAVIDVDDVIVPNPPYRTWPEVMQHLVSENPGSDCYYFQTRIILMEDGETSGWQQDRSAKLEHANAAEFPGPAVRWGKSICVAATQEIMSYHFSDFCHPANRPCTKLSVPIDLGEAYHYGSCWMKNCSGWCGMGTCEGQRCSVIPKTSLQVHNDSVRQGVLQTLEDF